MRNKIATILAPALLIVLSSFPADAAPGSKPQLKIQCSAHGEFYPDAAMPSYSKLFKPNAMYKYYGKKATVYKYLDGKNAGRVIMSRNGNSNEWDFFDSSVSFPIDFNGRAYSVKYKIVDSYKRTYTTVCSYLE